MKRIAWLLVLAVALTAMNAPIQAKAKKEGAAGAKAKRDKPKREKKPRGNKGDKGGLRGEHAMMAKVLNLTDTQKAQLAEKLKACAEETKKWREANADKLAEIKKQQAEAKKNKDKDAMKKIAAQSKELRAEEAKNRGAATAAAMSILTPEQKAQWAGFALYRQVVGKFKKVELTDEQDKKVRDMCNATAKDLPEDDKKARGKAYKELTTSIIESILTAEQKTKMTAKGGGKPKKERGDKPKKEPRKGKKKKGDATDPGV